MIISLFDRTLGKEAIVWGKVGAIASTPLLAIDRELPDCAVLVFGFKWDLKYSKGR